MADVEETDLSVLLGSVVRPGSTPDEDEEEVALEAAPEEDTGEEMVHDEFEGDTHHDPSGLVALTDEDLRAERRKAAAARPKCPGCHRPLNGGKIYTLADVAKLRERLRKTIPRIKLTQDEFEKTVRRAEKLKKQVAQLEEQFGLEPVPYVEEVAPPKERQRLPTFEEEQHSF